MTKVQTIIHASEVLTGAGIRLKNGKKPKEEDLGRILDGALVYSVRETEGQEIPQRVEWVGPTSELPAEWKKIKPLDLQQRQALIPGLVDCHNHLIFAGNRSKEFAARCAGATYQEIAAQGGGIQTTVAATRIASEKELEELAATRLRTLSAYGVRTIEIKSGYGLSLSSELKILRVIPKLRKRFPQLTLTATFLGAHDFPQDRTREEYLQEILDSMLPQVAREKLADSCDVFVDEGFYTSEEARKILTRAQELGLRAKIHADELFNTESASLAVELKALSADHLLKVSDEGIRKLANSDTVAVLLPGTAFYLKAAYAPARKLLDTGACVALATDFNPGTCLCLSLPTIMTIAALYLQMTRAEIFAAVTYNAAKALGLQEYKGTLEPGRDADFSVLPFQWFEDLYYHFAWAPTVTQSRFQKGPFALR